MLDRGGRPVARRDGVSDSLRHECELAGGRPPAALGNSSANLGALGVQEMPPARSFG